MIAILLFQTTTTSSSSSLETRRKSSSCWVVVDVSLTNVFFTKEIFDRRVYNSKSTGTNNCNEKHVTVKKLHRSQIFQTPVQKTQNTLVSLLIFFSPSFSPSNFFYFLCFLIESFLPPRFFLRETKQTNKQKVCLTSKLSSSSSSSSSSSCYHCFYFDSGTYILYSLLLYYY